MTDHLSDEQLTAALLAEDDAAAGEHLAACEPCRAELESLRAALGSVRADEQARAERPHLFWREQRMAIAAQIPAGREVTTRPLAWAGSLAVFALAAAWMTQSAPPAQPVARPAQDAAAVSAPADPDHDLLVDIQRSVRRDVPLALAPATLLAQELHDAANRKPDR
jgi:hypothetical protein